MSIEKKSNYDKFKEDALTRFLTFDQEKLISRLCLVHDDEYIYITYCGRDYRFYRSRPLLEYKDGGKWMQTDANEALALCDLLCHTEEPIELSDGFMSLQSLNRVKGGSTQTTLAKGWLSNSARYFDQNEQRLRKACEALGGVPCGKGDVAYEIPLFEHIHARISFYHSDDEFEAQMTILFPDNICNYLFYETLYYVTNTLLERLKSY